MISQKIVAIRCTACSRELCSGLRWIIDPADVCHDDGREMLPLGTVGRGSYGPIADLEWPAMNPSDLIVQRASLRDVMEIGVRNGCCGPDGGDGPNLSCICGSVIATEVGDCWLPHFVAMSHAAVDLVEFTRTRGDSL